MSYLTEQLKVSIIRTHNYIKAYLLGRYLQRMYKDTFTYFPDIAHDSQEVFKTNPLLLVVSCYKLSILHQMPKVVNVLAKTWFIKGNLQ